MEITKDEKVNFQQFKNNLLKLLSICDKICKFKQNKELHLYKEKTNVIYRCLNLYKQCFKKTSEGEMVDHSLLFQTIYNKHKDEITMDEIPTNYSSWLKNGKIIIGYGSNYGIKNRIKIYLSTIYNDALKIQDETNEKLKGLPSKLYDEALELNYPDILLLHLYQIFLSLNPPNNEVNSLNNIINDIKKDLGMNEENISNTSLGGVDSLVNMASNFLKNKGDPSGSPEHEITDTITNILQHEDTKKTIGNLFQGLQQSFQEGKGFDGLGGIVGNIIQSLNNGELFKSLKPPSSQKIKTIEDPPKDDPLKEDAPKKE